MMDEAEEVERFHQLIDAIELAKDADAKVAALHRLDRELPSFNVLPDPSSVMRTLKLLLKDPHQSVSSAALTFVPTFVTHLRNNLDQQSDLVHVVKSIVTTLLPIILERCGDSKDRIRESAARALEEIGRAAIDSSPNQLGSSLRAKASEGPLDVFEGLVRESGLMGKSAKIREQTCRALPALRKYNAKFPIKAFLSALVDMLADADPGCREASRSTLVALFLTASPAAKADLKKELERKNVRKALVDSILREVLGSNTAEHILATEASELLPETAPAASSSRPMAQASQTVTASSEENISPVYIASRSDLDRTFSAMQPAFEGKESEHNWLNRETSIIKLRGILKAGAAEQFGATFVNGIKTLADGILKAVASLRTTLAMQGISLISDLANQLGDDLEPCIDVFVPALLKMSGFTKKLVAAASQAAVKDIFVNVSYRRKFLDLIWAFMADKMITTRQAMSDHLYTLLVTHADHRRHALESHDGLATIEKFLKKGLGDQNKDVRARCRDSFIVYQRHWPARASTLIETLDPTTKKQLAAALQEASSAAHETSSSATASSSSAASAPSGSSGPTARKVSAPVGRPGGPSNAILAAKRAAAARMAQQKAEEQQRLEQEQVYDDDAGLSAGQVDEGGSSYGTTPAAASTTGKFRPDRNRSRTGPSTFATPGRSTAMPLDQEGTPSASRSTSGWARQASMTEDPHQHSRNASNGISTPRKGIASSPGYDNGGPSSSATRHLSKGESASSPGSIANRSPFVPNNFASRSPSKGFSAMDSLRASRASTIAPRDPDDTVQLGQGVGDDSLGDATVDLMQGSSSPLKRSGYAMDDTLTLGADQIQDEDETMLLRDDDSRTMEDESGALTPRVRPPQRAASSHSSDAPESTASKTGGNAISALQAMSLRQSEQYPKTPSGNSSADSSASKYGSGWLLDRASRLEAENMSPLKSKPDALQWVEEIQKGTADVKVFKHLNRLSAAFRVDASSSITNGQRASQLEPGRGVSSNSQAGRQKMLEEDEAEGDVDLTSPKLAQQTEAWREGHLFERLYQALSSFLLQDSPSPSTTRSTLEQAAITTLHSLLRNQYPLFLAHSLESNFLELILTLRKLKEGKWNGIDRTCLELLSTWSSMTVPALGWRSLLRIMDTSSQEDSTTTSSTTLQARLQILPLSTLSLLLSRLPIQVLQEESEGLKSFPFIWKAFTNRDLPMMRQVGTQCLVGVYTRLRKDCATEEEGVESCFGWIEKGLEGLKKGEGGESVGEFDAKTKDLLLYFFAQAEREN